MNPDSFGERFKITTFGESHSKAIGVLIEGIKPNVKINIKDIQKLLDERKPKNKLTTKRKEEDKILILSGIFEGKTLGSPIVAIVFNKDAKEKDYQNIKDIFRPSHADYTFFKKYGIRDYRGGGRSSGRETISRVASGAIAISFLKEKNIKIESKITKLGPFETTKWDKTEKYLPFADKNKLKEIENYIKNLNGDSIGAIVETRILGLEAGVGEPVFEKLEANIAKAVLSIGAIKGIEFGDGFMFASEKGSEANDQMDKNGFLSNHSGGISGGISNGETIIFRSVIKPTPSISKEQKTIDVKGKEVTIKIKGRHDPCIAIRIIPVINSMVALTVVNLIEENKLYKEKDTLSIKELRDKIKKIDKNLFLLLDERFQLIEKIAKYKTKNNLKIENKEIEKNLLKNIRNLNLKYIDNYFIKKLYEIIFKESKKMQEKIKKKL